jgi:WD40 repeat protein
VKAKVLLFLTMILVIGNIFSTQVTLAQDSSVITTENVTRLTEVATLNIQEAIYGLSFGPDGKSLVVAGASGVHFYEILTGEPGDKLLQEEVDGISFQPGGVLIAAYSLECSPGNCRSNLYVLDAATGEGVLSLELDGFSEGVSFSPDGSLLVYAVSQTSLKQEGNLQGTTAGPSQIHVVNAETGEEILTIEDELAVRGPVFFNSNASHIVYQSMPWTNIQPAANEGKVHIIEVETGKEISTMATTSSLTAFSSNQNLAFFQPYDRLTGRVGMVGSAKVIRFEADEVVMELPAGEIWEVDFSPASSVMAITGGDLESTLSLRSTSDGEELTSFTIDGVDRGHLPTFSHDGTLLAVMYLQGNGVYVKVWGIEN